MRGVLIASAVVAVAIGVAEGGQELVGDDEPPAFSKREVEADIDALTASARVERDESAHASLMLYSRDGKRPYGPECVFSWGAGGTSEAYRGAVASAERQGWRLKKRSDRTDLPYTTLAKRGWTLSLMPSSVETERRGADYLTVSATKDDC